MKRLLAPLTIAFVICNFAGQPVRNNKETPLEIIVEDIKCSPVVNDSLKALAYKKEVQNQDKRNVLKRQASHIVSLSNQETYQYRTKIEELSVHTDSLIDITNSGDVTITCKQ